MLDLNHPENQESPDGLFLERLEAFMDKCLLDIKAFSDRESRPFEETRRHVAEWHCRHLFQPRSIPTAATQGGTPSKERKVYARSVLCESSRLLESLGSISGIQSFLLAVDPSTSDTDDAFLGGTVTGREFWRGLRNGGEAGARSFKVHCIKDTKIPTANRISSSAEPPLNEVSGDFPARNAAAAGTVLKRGPTSSAVKSELYAHVRNALRIASGIRNAEMKWTNHDRLGIYGVKLIGWPHTIPPQNPSTLSASQNKLLLESMVKGTMKFVRINQDPAASAQHQSKDPPQDQGSGSNDLRSWTHEEHDSAPLSTSNLCTSDALIDASVREQLRVQHDDHDQGAGSSSSESAMNVTDNHPVAQDDDDVADAGRFLYNGVPSSSETFSTPYPDDIPLTEEDWEWS